MSFKPFKPLRSFKVRFVSSKFYPVQIRTRTEKKNKLAVLQNSSEAVPVDLRSSDMYVYSVAV